MHLSEDDEILGTAARFLFNTGEEDAARTLLMCSLTVEESEFFGMDRRRLLLYAPDRPFQILQDRRNPLTLAITNALGHAVPHAPIAPRIFQNEFDLVLAYPDRDAERQAALIEFARGSDTPLPVIEATPSRPGVPHLLITPISIFPVEQVRRDQQLCFVIMPFSGAFDDVYKYGIKPAVEAANLTCLRGDDIKETGDILRQIWTSLLKSKFVIADLTHTNGNVLYELGLAHALGHSAILLTQDINDVPFDLRQQRHIVYRPTRDGLDEGLKPELTAMLQGMLDQSS